MCRACTKPFNNRHYYYYSHAVHENTEDYRGWVGIFALRAEGRRSLREKKERAGKGRMLTRKEDVQNKQNRRKQREMR